MAATPLTTLVDLKAYLEITVAGDDTILTAIIGQVSEMFEKRTRRVLGVQGSATTRTRRVGVDWKAIVLAEWPNTGLVVVEDGVTLVLDTDYELRGDLRSPQSLYRINGLLDISWPSHAKVVISATEGSALVEIADLQAACNEQSAFAFRQSAPGGGANGLLSRENTSQLLTFLPYDIQPAVAYVLANYMRPF